MGRLEGYLGIPDGPTGRGEQAIINHIYEHRHDFFAGGHTRGGFVSSDFCRAVLRALGGANCAVEQLGHHYQAHCVWQKRLLVATGRDNAEATARLLMAMYGARTLIRGQVKTLDWDELKSIFAEES